MLVLQELEARKAQTEKLWQRFFEGGSFCFLWLFGKKVPVVEDVENEIYMFYQELEKDLCRK